MFETKQFKEVPHRWILSGTKFIGAIDGSSYYVFEDYEDDNMKMSHFIQTDIDGRVYEISQSPYQLLTMQEVAEIGFVAMEFAEYDDYIAQGE